MTAVGNQSKLVRSNNAIQRSNILKESAISKRKEYTLEWNLIE